MVKAEGGAGEEAEAASPAHSSPLRIPQSRAFTLKSTDDFLFQVLKIWADKCCTCHSVTQISSRGAAGKQITEAKRAGFLSSLRLSSHFPEAALNNSLRFFFVLFVVITI